MIKTVIKHDDNYYYDVIRRNLKKIRTKKEIHSRYAWRND